MAAHNDLLEWYLAALHVGEYSEPTRVEQTSQRYSRIVKTAQEYVMEQQGAGYSVTDICEVTNTSERTLQYAFQKILGMTPIEYLIRLRLHRVHRDLRTEHTRITHREPGIGQGLENCGELGVLGFR